MNLRWTKIEALYHSVLDLEPSRREAFLKAACGDDEELFREITSLVAHTGDSFMEVPAFEEAMNVISRLQKETSPKPAVSNFDWTIEWSETLACFPRTTWGAAAYSPIHPGDVLASRYRIVRTIGQGGMGHVYEAEDLKRKKSVALKTIRSEIANDPEILYRFKNEFRALAEVTHPSLVNLYEVISDGEIWFFTMEMIRGVNFLAYLKNDDSSKTKLRAALLYLVEAVLALHNAQKLHRDIKPSNILIDDNNRLTLIDFGLVTELISEDLQHRLTLVGTPAYMSPEQVMGQELREASDWYSVGTVLYEALTGKLPFKEDGIECLKAKISREPPAPAEVSPGVPPDLSKVAQALLRLDPASRPPGRELLRHIRAGVSPEALTRVPMLQSHSGHVFVGREKELAKLNGALEKVKAGGPVTVHISGKSGVGKSALARCFLERVERDFPECVVLLGRCYERESVPFNALDSLVDELSQYWKQLPEPERRLLLPADMPALLRLFPVLRQVDLVARLGDRESIPDFQQLRLRAFEALRQIIDRIGQRRPLLLAIDDLQWADADSVSLLRYLFEGFNPLPALFLFSYRDQSNEAGRESVFSEIKSLGSNLTEVCTLGLNPLALEEASELASRLLADQKHTKNHTLAIANESGGMPFFVDALVRYSRSWEEMNLNSRAKQGASAAASVSLDGFVQTLKSNLPAKASLLLELIAIAGEPVELDLLHQATGFDIEGPDALPMLRMENLVRVLQSKQETRIEIYHDRVREAVTSGIPADGQRDQCQRFASALEASGCSDFARMAILFHRAGDVASARKYAIPGAEQAAETLAFDRSAQLYRLGLEAQGPGDPENTVIRSKLAGALVNAGKGADAAGEYLSASKTTNGIDALLLKQKAAEQLLRSGHIDEGFELLYALCKLTGVRLARTSLGILIALLLRRMQLMFRGLHFEEYPEGHHKGHELIRVDICWALGIGWSVVDTIRGSEAQTLFLLLALNAGEPYRISLGLAGEAAYSAFRGRPRRSAQLLATAHALARKVGKPHAAALAVFCEGMCDWVSGNWEKTVQACRKAQDIYTEQCKGVTWEVDIARIFELASLAWMGRWKEHSDRLPAFRREAESRGDLFASVSLPLLTYSYMMMIGSDDTEGARNEVQTLIRRWSQKDYHVQHFWAMHGEVETALYCGDAELAYSRVDRDWPALKNSLQLHLPLGAVFAYYLRARTRLEKARTASADSFVRNECLRDAGRDANQIEKKAMSCSGSIAFSIRAAIASMKGQTQSAADLLLQSESGFQRTGMTIHAAAIRRRRGELMANQNGRALTLSADDAMASEGIKRPDRIAAMIAPGF